ncbi:hypothetical protein EGT07_14800 [Herbaspirillum sp. HC18]|nr:hypothetical protein EGT07_14800 [Herbaspirillum sp. HC18]
MTAFAIVAETSLPQVKRALVNYFATMFVLFLGFVFYSKFSGYHMRLYGANWMPDLGVWRAGIVIRTVDVFRWVFVAYAGALIPFYLFQPDLRSKAAVVLGYVFSIDKLSEARKPSKEEHQALLVLLLKFIFVPFCLNGLLGHAALLNNQLLAVQRGGMVDIVALSLNLIFVIDFLPFVAGYLFECRWLKNEIVAVDATLGGWVVCLLCYPPFNGALGQFLPWASRDHVQWSQVPLAWLYYGLNGVLVVLFLLYASASVSLGLKCSNLTNRGTVSSGLYGVIRHPAYALKNLAWWIAALPSFVVFFRDSFAVGMYSVFSLAGWTTLYALRALSEERNMLAVDTGYRDYMQRVRWRFIPGVV